MSVCPISIINSTLLHLNIQCTNNEQGHKFIYSMLSQLDLQAAYVWLSIVYAVEELVSLHPELEKQ